MNHIVMESIRTATKYKNLDFVHIFQNNSFVQRSVIPQSISFFLENPYRLDILAGGLCLVGFGATIGGCVVFLNKPFSYRKFTETL